MTIAPSLHHIAACALVAWLGVSSHAAAQPALSFDKGSGGAGRAAPTRSGHAYPTKLVRVIVPIAAGGSSDIVARHMSTGFGRQLG